MSEHIKRTSPFPDLTRNPVELSSISLRRNLPIGWDQLTGLASSINRLKADAINRQDIERLIQDRSFHQAVPMISSVVAHKANPTIPEYLPSAEEIKIMKPWFRNISRLIGRFSQTVQGKFDHLVERQGAQIVKTTGQKIIDVAELAAQTPNPRQQFVHEIHQLYNQLLTPEQIVDPGLFGDTSRPKTIEEKIQEVLRSMRMIRYGDRDYSNWLTEANFPLLNKLLPVIGFPPVGLDEDETSIVAVEMMSGIETFLRREGINNISRAPEAVAFTPLDVGTWRRGLAELFGRDRLDAVKSELPIILRNTMYALPTNGPEFSEKIYDLAVNVTILKAQGHDDKIIVDSLLK